MPGANDWPPVSELSLYGRETPSVFDLLGRREVDLTAALGWTLSRSPSLLGALWRRLDMPGDSGDVTAALEVAGPEGRTDLELVGTEATAIIEAKKGWLLPGETQLTKYLSHFTPDTRSLLVSLSDSSAEWAAVQLPAEVAGVPVQHLPWDDVRAVLTASLQTTRNHTERLWLTELRTYLAGATAVRDPSEQWVYNVVLSNRPFGDSTFIEWVTERRVYFHPSGVGNGWPKRPPVLMGFRWNGRVRQVNRMVGATIYANLNDRFPDVPRDADPLPHVVYDLGPDLPIPPLPTRGTYATARVWALLDQMMTQPTLQGAVRSSKELTRDGQ